jgi:hypothetical protein
LGNANSRFLRRDRVWIWKSKRLGERLRIA